MRARPLIIFGGPSGRSAIGDLARERHVQECHGDGRARHHARERKVRSGAARLHVHAPVFHREI